MTPVKVSICIPVYNGVRYLNEAIDSVLNQTFKNFELIVLDNCSTDHTVELVKQYKDPRVKLVQNETNVGLLGNWNKILSLATGEYVKMLPADDAIYPDCLQLQVEVLEADREKKISLVCGRKNIVDKDGKVLFNRGFAKKRMEVSSKDAVNKNVRSGGNIIGEPGVVLFRKEVLAKTGYYDGSIYYVTDLNLWFRILLHGNLYVLPNPVCIFRISNESESTKIMSQQKKDMQNFIKKIYSEKAYGLSRYSYVIGMAAVEALSLAKKLVYRFFLKS